MSTVASLVLLEERILAHYIPKYAKQKENKIAKQLSLGYIKLSEPLPTGGPGTFVLKLSGIWEMNSPTTQIYGITYKFSYSS
jgi:hypothetical protein